MAVIQARQDRLGAQTRWALRGRLSVTQDTEGFHGRVLWQQDGERYVIDLIGPLGQGRQQIRGDGHQIELQTAARERFMATDADELVAQLLGFALPVKGLRYWVRGLPSDEPLAQMTPDAQGQPRQLEQAGWRITYENYRNQLPMRLTAERLGNAQTPLKLQLVIDGWQTS